MLSWRFSFCKVRSSALLSLFPWLTVLLFQGNRAVREGHCCRGDGSLSVPKASPTESSGDPDNDFHLDSEIMGEFAQRAACQDDVFIVACVAKQTDSCFL